MRCLLRHGAHTKTWLFSQVHTFPSTSKIEFLVLHRAEELGEITHRVPVTQDTAPEGSRKAALALNSSASGSNGFEEVPLQGQVLPAAAYYGEVSV